MAHKDAVLMPEPSKMQLSDIKNYLFFPADPEHSTVLIELQLTGVLVPLPPSDACCSGA